MIQRLTLAVAVFFVLQVAPAVAGPIQLLNKDEGVTGTGEQTVTIDTDSIKASGSAFGYSVGSEFAQGSTYLDVNFLLQSVSHVLLSITMDAGRDGPNFAAFQLSDDSDNVLQYFEVGVFPLLHIDQSLAFDLTPGKYNIHVYQNDPAELLNSTSYNFTFTATAVPEPSSLLLMLAGLALGHIARRHRRA